MKQKTFEEFEKAALKYNEQFIGGQESRYAAEDFINGAKWQQENSNENALDFEIDSLKREIKVLKHQQERSYNEEDMAESFMACWKANVPEGFECKLSFNEWFEQFKKK